ncbi:MAG: NifB/NifX family molybdenum-iron cluster-binding protein, partial [Candidatus Acetothermia bacterium]
MKFIVACGTSDGEKLTDDHFGESNYFYIYDLSGQDSKFVKKLENDTREEDVDLGHGDPGKAKEVSQILKKESVTVGLAHQMGPNIIKISKRFVPVIYRGREVDRAIDLLLDNIHLVEREWRKGEKRDYVVLDEK